jgi:hypothetical protein
VELFQVSVLIGDVPIEMCLGTKSFTTAFEGTLVRPFVIPLVMAVLPLAPPDHLRRPAPT